MRINRKWLLIKVHYFFFHGAMGPILPQITVYGKELGISSIVMGTITAILPIAFFLAKPLFGLLVDIYRNYRKFIFIMLIVIMNLFFAGLYFVPPTSLTKLHLNNITSTSVELCNDTNTDRKSQCDKNQTIDIICTSKCLQQPTSFLLDFAGGERHEICFLSNATILTNSTCDFICEENIETNSNCIYKTFTFWGFVLFMCVGLVGYNVVNSISDAICFDVIGEKGDYGRQRVWGTIGYGVTALISGVIVDLSSTTTLDYTPAFVLMLICSGIDIITCAKLQLPIMETPKNIFKELKEMLKDWSVVTFLSFATFAGILDSLMVFFLFWYLEDMAAATNTDNVKLIEGLTVAAETLGGEIIFFSVSGKILKRLGHVNCFSSCFFFYALRIGLISLVPSPWWIIPIEFCLNGPTWALTYSTIVAYANDLAPAGASATMQGIAAGMDDGLGFTIGSIIAGSLFKYVGAKHTLEIFSVFGLLCGISHALLHKFVLKEHVTKGDIPNVEYKAPEEALKAVS